MSRSSLLDDGQWELFTDADVDDGRDLLVTQPETGLREYHLTLAPWETVDECKYVCLSNAACRARYAP